MQNSRSSEGADVTDSRDPASGLPALDRPGPFFPDQIVCLEWGDRRLFAEVVQIIEERSRCWVRPLALAEIIADSLALRLCYDLRESSHLVLAQHFFRAALDTEVIPIMSALFHPEKQDSEEDEALAAEAQQALYQFIQAMVQGQLKR